MQNDPGHPYSNVNIEFSGAKHHTGKHRMSKTSVSLDILRVMMLMLDITDTKCITGQLIYLLIMLHIAKLQFPLKDIINC